MTWTPPTQNTDGSPLNNLAGYRVYWGTQQGNYSNSVTIANPGLAPVRAAASPARGVDYLFYVRKPSSLAHYFTASESDFLRKVCEYGYACD